MRSVLLKRLAEASFSRARSNSFPFALSPFRYMTQRYLQREETILSHGLSWALARKGIIVKDQAFRNLESSELKKKGATIAESLSGLPVHVRGNVVGGTSEISKAQFSKLLKQVTNHLSSVSNVFVHDGAIGSSSKCDAKVRVISDNPTAVLLISNILFTTPTRAISHDTCPVTVYVASSISESVGSTIGPGASRNPGFIAVDIDRASIILNGKAFSDTNGIKEALTAIAGPVISARGGIPLSARLLGSGDSIILLFAAEDIVKSCSGQLVSADAGVILTSHDVAPFFQTGNSNPRNLCRLPAALILAYSDSSGAIPSVSRLSPGQAAYHFLAGYHNGKFIPAYNKGPSSIDPLELSKALLAKLKDNQIVPFLINTHEGKEHITGADLVKLVRSTTLSKNISLFQPKGGDLEANFKSFLSSKFQEIPEEMSF
ncbi:hypothetical protein Nepgr_030028 [Nepenthes gracilis]|uniref:phosphoenolpyruvate carboxykinase (ATP) n=1 Tax=Nepenthes gracilis TaxID=150966 RepID=A0AAD3Y5G3_NEPGR|nr:hypothetical protein Nepgr_030028 [Nepenthes gracilis]